MTRVPTDRDVSVQNVNTELKSNAVYRLDTTITQNGVISVSTSTKIVMHVRGTRNRYKHSHNNNMNIKREIYTLNME